MDRPVPLYRNVVSGPTSRGRGAEDDLFSLMGAPQVRRALEPVAEKLLASSKGSAVYCVASSRTGEGRTLIASTLSLMFSEETEKKVLLIDANMQTPRINELFDLPQSPGFADCLRDESRLFHATGAAGRLNVMPSGRVERLVQLLRMPEAKSLLQTIRKRYDLAIIDTPPLASGEEAAALCNWSDGTVMVVRANATSASEVTRAVGLIDSRKMLGVVLNQEQRDLPPWIKRWL